MKKKSYKYVIGICIAVLLAGLIAVGTLFLPHKNSYLEIQTPNGSIHALEATSSADQERGLGDRDQLPMNEGMLFEFAQKGNYGFWMKDMRFALDMIWIDEKKNVVSVSLNVPADSYPQIFLPAAPVLYVLEVDAGQAYAHGIATGTILKF